MKKHLQRGLALLLSLLLCLSLIPVASAETTIVDSGTCGAQGDNVTWTLDSEGTLTVAGTGSMTDWSQKTDTPWWPVYDKIERVIVEDGVTSVGAHAFEAAPALKCVLIGNDVEEVMENAFANCGSLYDLLLGKGVAAIEESAFSNDTALSCVTLPASLRYFGAAVFEGCTGLKNVRFMGTAPYFVVRNVRLPNGDAQFYDTFKGVTATACYPSGEVGWTDDTRLDYGGTLTWTAKKALGTCGAESASPIWTLEEDGTLTISGTGAMADYMLSDVERTQIVHHDEVGHYEDWVNEEAFDEPIRRRRAACNYPDCGYFSPIVGDGAVSDVNNHIFEEHDGMASYSVRTVVIGYVHHEKGPETVWVVDSEAYDERVKVTVTASSAPWQEQQDQIQKVIIGDEVTHIGSYAFWNCKNLQNVQFSGDAPSAENTAFEGVIAAAEYPKDRADSWTKEAKSAMGGTLTWPSDPLEQKRLSGVLKSWDADLEAEFLLYPADMSDADIRADLALDKPTKALASGSGGDTSASGNGYTQSFTFDGVEAGQYKMALNKAGGQFVPRIVEVDLSDSDEELDLGNLSLNKLGDLDGDGKINVWDATQAYYAARGDEGFDDYTKACADVDGDGKVKAWDATQIYDMAKNQ